MDKISCSFTVFFEDPFWVGVFERRKAYQGEDLLTACKITFGAQPTDPQVYEYLLEHYRDLKQQNLAKNPQENPTGNSALCSVKWHRNQITAGTFQNAGRKPSRSRSTASGAPPFGKGRSGQFCSVKKEGLRTLFFDF